MSSDTAGNKHETVKNPTIIINTVYILRAIKANLFTDQAHCICVSTLFSYHKCRV